MDVCVSYFVHSVSTWEVRYSYLMLITCVVLIIHIIMSASCIHIDYLHFIDCTEPGIDAQA